MHAPWRSTSAGTEEHNHGYQTILNRIHFLQNNDIPFGVISVIHGGNCSNAREYVDFLVAERISSVSLNVEFNCGLSLDPDLIARMTAFFCDLYDEIKSQNVHVQVREIRDIIGYLTNREVIQTCWRHRDCGSTYFGIDVRGCVYRYCDKFMAHGNDEMKLGRLGESTLRDLLQTEDRSCWRHLVAVDRFCEQCSIQQYCKGGCVFERYLLLRNNGSLQHAGEALSCCLRRKLVEHIARDFRCREDRSMVPFVE
jgi:radical SAM protein with 4Fe4S-binding SPASM domain